MNPVDSSYFLKAFYQVSESIYQVSESILGAYWVIFQESLFGSYRKWQNGLDSGDC